MPILANYALTSAIKKFHQFCNWIECLKNYPLKIDRKTKKLELTIFEFENPGMSRLKPIFDSFGPSGVYCIEETF